MKQKNIFIIPALILMATFLSIPGGYARAEDGTAGEIRKDFQEKREELQSEMKDKKEALKTEFKDKRENLRERFRKDISERVRKEFEMMTKRFNAAIERLDRLGDRIDSRIAKIKAAGKDTTDAEKSVSDARAKIEQAKLDIAKLPGLINQVLTTSSSTASTTPPTGQFKEVRNLADTIRQELKDAHKLFNDAIRKIRGLHVGEDLEGREHRTSTSTATSTP
jgi:chromosome segregation ATPase